MAELKTRVSDASVIDFLDKIQEEGKRQDALAILQMMKEATGSQPKMWGDAIVGFGDVHLRYDSGRELDWFKMGFSPQKQNLTLYGLGGFEGHQELLDRLGKHKRGKGCLYINRLSDVDLGALKDLIGRSAAGK